MKKQIEEWRPAVGWEGLYEVSNQGRVKSLAKSWISANGSVRTKEETPKAVRKNKGYLITTLHKQAKATTVSVHRLVADAFIPKIKGKSIVNHIDSNRSNNNVCNLEWVTTKENVTHALLKGNMKMNGSKNKSSVLVESQVREMRKKWKSGNYTYVSMAAEYGVGRQTVHNIINYANWRHI